MISEALLITFIGCVGEFFIEHEEKHYSDNYNDIFDIYELIKISEDKIKNNNININNLLEKIKHKENKQKKHYMKGPINLDDKIYFDVQKNINDKLEKLREEEHKIIREISSYKKIINGAHERINLLLNSKKYIIPEVNKRIIEAKAKGKKFNKFPEDIKINFST